MKVTCTISGTSFNTGDQLPLHITSKHPIFQAQTKQLWKLVADAEAGRLDNQAKTLLFLALLDRTGLLQQQRGYAAQPSIKTVNSNMKMLVAAVSWIFSVQHPGVHFPHYIISQQNEDMSNITHWIQLIFEAKADFLAGIKERDQQVKLAEQEQILQRALQRQEAGIKQMNRRQLATWAMETSDAPAEMREFWSKILAATSDQVIFGQLTMSNSAILPINKETVAELHEWMDEELPHGTSLKHEVMRIIGSLLGKQEAGLGLFELIDDEGNAINYISDSSSQHQEIDELLAGDELPPEPRQELFISKTQYLVAKARWSVTCSAIRARQEHQAQVIAQLDEVNKLIEQDAVDNLEAGDETGDEA